MVSLPIHLWEVGRFKTKICKNEWKWDVKGWQRSGSHHCQPFTHVTCATDYIGRVTERNEFHWVHYDLDGPAHLDPTYTGTGIYYRSIYWSKIYRYRLRVPVPVQGFRGLFYTSWSDLIPGTIVPLVLRSNIDLHADLSWLFCMICHGLIYG